VNKEEEKAMKKGKFFILMFGFIFAFIVGNNQISLADTIPINTWVPTSIYVEVEPHDWDPDLRYIYSSFLWDSDDHLSGFHQDNNETYEGDVVFYNYDDSAYCYEWSGSTRGTFWDSNQPRAYLDTQASDGDDERPFCVGCPDASLFQKDTSYYYWITPDITQSSEGMAKIAPQRGHRSPSNVYSTWSVFSDQTVIVIPFTSYDVPGWTSWSQ